MCLHRPSGRDINQQVMCGRVRGSVGFCQPFTDKDKLSSNWLANSVTFGWIQTSGVYRSACGSSRVGRSSQNILTSQPGVICHVSSVCLRKLVVAQQQKHFPLYQTEALFSTDSSFSTNASSALHSQSLQTRCKVMDRVNLLFRQLYVELDSEQFCSFAVYCNLWDSPAMHLRLQHYHLFAQLFI